MRLVNRFWNDDSGTTAIEYGLVASGVVIAILVGVSALGAQVLATYSKISGAAGGPGFTTSGG